MNKVWCNAFVVEQLRLFDSALRKKRTPEAFELVLSEDTELNSRCHRARHCLRVPHHYLESVEYKDRERNNIQ